MNNYSELKFFLLKCLSPIFLIKVFGFLIGKIVDRQKSFLKPSEFYPPKVKKVYMYLNREAITTDNVSVEEYTINECELNLCSKKFLFEDESAWFIEYEDQEYTFALHRWNWLLTSLGDGSNISSREWGVNMMRSWVNNILDKKNTYAWHPYTTGERISNSYMFGIFTSEILDHHLLAKVLPDDIVSALFPMARHLSDNLEYKGRGKTGNHVINNARALLFASILFNDRHFSDLSFSILRSSLPELILGDGFLREGSSHYQFIFTRWILEMLWFSKLSNKNDIHDFILPFATKLVNQCRFFLVEDIENNLLSIPLIGDVSPDFPIDWISYLPFSKIAVDLCDTKKIPDLCSTRFGWTYLVNRKSNLFYAKN